MLDVVILGAGLSGLSAATELSRLGHSVAVVEARDRVGGRTFTIHVDKDDSGKPLEKPVAIDLGGQWVGATHATLRSLLAEFRIETSPQPDEGEHILYVLGKRYMYNGNISTLNLRGIAGLDEAIEELDQMALTLPEDAPYTARYAPDWDRVSMEAWVQDRLSDKQANGTARQILEWAVRCIFSCEPSQISLLYFLWFLRTAGGYSRLSDIRGGAQQDRICGGSQQISEKLAMKLGKSKISLGDPVVVVEHSASAVTCTMASGAKFVAKYCIIAMAPAMANNIRYSPPMPVNRRQLMMRMPQGSCIKCIVGYERNWWKEKGLSAECLSDKEPIFLTYDDTTPEGKPAIIGFIVGDAAVRWGARPQSERKAAVIAFLVDTFGAEAGKYDLYLDKGWADEEFSGGCYISLMPPGVLSNYGAALREPVGRIHFAGTETSTVNTGYMDGACVSGYREAKLVHERLAVLASKL